MKISFVRRLLALGALALIARSAEATWSVLIVDRATGEIALAQATCIVGPNLQNKLAVVIPGVGAACVQAWWDNAGTRRTLIWNDFLEGRTPDEILAHLNTLGNPQLYQFGIVAASGDAATFTGTSAGAWAGGITGSAGDLAWAIQGNVLAGAGVVQAAEAAILSTPGALPEKLMAAMLAAAAMGGDGRCSCSPTLPDSCGTPPPGFDLTTGKSAHVGFLIVARLGDGQGICDGQHGCANGDYYMDFNIVPGQNAPPDPIVAMEALYTQWRAALLGRPDALESQTQVSPPAVVGNGVDQASLRVRLADWQTTAIGHGGATLVVRHAVDSAGLATIGTPIDQGDGSYSVPLSAGAGVGLDRFEVWVDDGQGAVLLSPFPELQSTPSLHADATTLSASSGGSIGFELEGPPASGSPRSYLLLGSLSGTAPGRPFGELVLPLNPDRFFAFTWSQANGPILQDTRGSLDAAGRAQARLVAPPGFFVSSFVGSELAFAYFLTDQLDFVSNPVAVLLVP